jgi:hypothetical protein
MPINSVDQFISGLVWINKPFYVDYYSSGSWIYLLDSTHGSCHWLILNQCRDLDSFPSINFLVIFNKNAVLSISGWITKPLNNVLRIIAGFNQLIFATKF